jgi:hypothetical protein
MPVGAKFIEAIKHLQAGKKNLFTVVKTSTAFRFSFEQVDAFRLRHKHITPVDAHFVKRR